MSRIQIPLDMLTSRLNLGDRFSGMRSTSLSTRFANLKPISEFLDLKRLSKPANFSEIQSRVNYNLGHFSSNYAVVFLMLSIYSLLTNMLLLFVIVLVVGGMWGIGKLDGQDLHVGTFRATSSQLYTGLLRSEHLGTRLVHGQTDRRGFFRGGGLGGRPRSPEVVPPWGRPPGARGSRRRRQWEAERAMWENRVEELDSDDTDTQGVGLHSDYKRFSSDTLQFTGIDLGGGASTTRARKTYTLQDSEESLGDSAESEFEGTDALQVALRDKEEALVQSALARIRRAQEKGKKEVKLNKAEVDALERRRKRMQAAATTKQRKESGSSGGSETERRRRSDRNIAIPIASVAPLSQPNSRPSSRKRAKSTSKRTGEATPPVMLVAGPDGLAYAPSGSYTPPLAGSRNSPTRPRSATTQQLRGSAPPAYFTYTQPRHVSEGTRPPSSSSTSSRRPLPDDENWEPSSSRRSSASSQNYILNPFDYQISSDAPPPIPAHYLQPQGQPQGRRNVSGPAEVNYSSVRRSMQPPPHQSMASGSGSYSTGNRASTSDPSIPRRRTDYEYEYESRDQGRARDREREEINLVSSSEDEEDESDDLGNGVEVFVDEREERARERDRQREREAERPVSRKPVGGDGRGSARRKGKR
ncbi:related to prenylated Rab acceptor 1 [Phialocephala subalpina]|uniref:Related to prenylated Rab acceptor 1 n=1 Tax=Phialocephala subalpina TaxID=576137 RepID=A0A1L7WEL9_9HELO|nr:related to prenylated Rab acceptor 1 [Phialocephala subalpina]